MIILSNVSVIEIGYSKIKQDIEEKREIKKHVIESVLFGSYNILNSTVNAKNPERLYQQV
jgi:hypothetical protein